MRIIDYFDQGAALDPSALLIVSDDRDVDYAEASEHSWRTAAALDSSGFHPGDRVGVLAPNVAEAFLAMLGIWRAGCS